MKNTNRNRNLPISKNQKRRKMIRLAVLIIDNLSIGMLWGIALATLAYAILREVTK